MTQLNIKQLMSGGIITNYFCTSSCGHCLYNCSPKWEKRYIDADIAEKSLNTILSLGCRSVHLGGGEPLLRPDDLAAVLKIASELGVSVEYVETNSSWFKDISSAVDFLSGLRNQGLHTLLVSISPFHNEHIPFSKVKGVIEAAGRAGVGIFPWVTDFISDLSLFEAGKTHSLAEFNNVFGRNYLLQVLERYWIHMGGRALETYRPLMGQKTFHQIMDESSANCYGELSSTSHFHIDLFGNYIPGLCSGLSIAIEDLGKPLSDETYPVVTTLGCHGIRELVKMAAETCGYSPQKDLYINKCDHSEVRPISGTNANEAVFSRLLCPGDVVMVNSTPGGGHISHHLDTLAQMGIATYEMMEFGEQYADDTIKNARALAAAFDSYGFDVQGKEFGYTDSHQVAVNVKEFRGGERVSKTLELNDIILNMNMLPHEPLRNHDRPEGIRIGVQEMTRVGMDDKAMGRIAELIKECIIDKKPVKEEVNGFRAKYKKIKYSYDSAKKKKVDPVEARKLKN